MLEQQGLCLSQVPPTPLSDVLSAEGTLMSHQGSSSGGYADFLLRYAAITLYNVEVADIQWRTLRLVIKENQWDVEIADIQWIL